MRSAKLVILLALALLWPAGFAQGGGPSHARIAFQRSGNNRKGLQIWTMRPDGSYQRRLTRAHIDYNPVWSPDRTKIVFQRLLTDEHVDLFVMNARGRKATRLTTAKNLDGYAAWSPDGGRIAYTRNFKRDGDMTSQIFLMDADGSDVEQLTNSKFSSALPTWSPTGRRIAFISGNACESRRQRKCGTAVYVMQADGTDRERISPFNRTTHAEYPAWSPNGRWIAYDRTGDCCLHTGIYLVRPSGAKHHRITNNVVR
ncbi:MAG TPA: hypothetical protein VIG64_08035, partial [Actinomycetota bacterium]